MVKISIIVPVFKAEQYITRCIESVLNQNYTDWELILVDDGSPDKSGKICDRYAAKDSRIRVFHKKNGGVSSARNLGITKAEGTWITFIDSDDWVDNNYLEAFNCTDDTQNKTIYVQGIARNVPDGRLLDNMFSYPKESFSSFEIEKWRKFEVLKNGCPVAKLFNRLVVLENNLKFNEQISINEDHLFVTDYYRYVDIIHLLPVASYHYYFDFKVESLTKKYHSSDEYIRIANIINLSLKYLCDKLNVLSIDICPATVHYLFGLKQLVLATLSAVHEYSSYNNYSRCIDEYSVNSNIINIKPIDFYSSLFCFFARNKMYFVGYLSASIYNWIQGSYRYCVNAVKKYILKR